jgi:hypothetical protein
MELLNQIKEKSAQETSKPKSKGTTRGSSTESEEK